tara:strand:- start:232 stop:936 length:705 start_codon:yes stop_codon:yes gene_type:complete
MTRLGTFGGGSGETLTVTLTEAITIDARDYGSKQIMTFTGINDVYKRILTAITIEQDLLEFGAIAKNGVFDVDDVRYIRVSNLDDTNYIKLTVSNTAGDEAMVTLDKGQSFMICGDMATGVNNMFIANQGSVQFVDATVDTTAGAFTQACDASKLIKVGQAVVGTGVPADATVATVNTPGAVTSFTLSAEASSSETNTSCTFTANQTSGLTDLSKITVQADTASVDVEVYVASV